ncbi:efflux RND transporter periplasmic adaptor subunit [Candidatus Marimicrobium litorale]|jgi:RND family efflux transporter MFP subunit|uniref:Efflux RND transporter periplasmic adaptor subunit n=1 Tax=Candidatus Marimicrobium litorale TaxID=2518991 RepID=A0ABT3T4T9_9GAMM|nr:efflux RND transporter periplasmic adaptor subunit [Candidatus Marimicrobium litorale]MCX2977190.1 efflux RND transporter periplasmic adaptor subunit [Candidatus Marimicrobium litorale]
MFSLSLSLVSRRCVCALGLFFLAACSDTPDPGDDVSSDPSVQAVVETVVLEARDWQGEIASFGVVEALEEVDVAAELSGTVKAVHIKEGDRVQSGQLLLELDDQKRQLALDQANQAVQRAKATLEEARLRLKRRKDLAERESVSREVLDNAQLNVDGAAAAFQQAVASGQLAERELADTRIYSPTDGLVDVRAVEEGESVQAGASLVKLQAVHGLRMQAWVSEADISNVHPGGDARVNATAFVDRDYAARVEWVGVNADPKTGNFPVKLILTDDALRLRPGMTASATLQGVSFPDALLLPEEALVDRNRRSVVFVVEDGVARMREPLLAAGFSNRLRIISGLEPGDSVIIGGQSRLLDGTPVNVRQGD